MLNQEAQNLRRNRITASRARDIVVPSYLGNPLKVYLDMVVGEKGETTNNQIYRRGIRMEELFRKEWSEQNPEYELIHGKELFPETDGVIVMDEWSSCSIDYVAVAKNSNLPPFLIEVKTDWRGLKWGDDVPPYYHVQVLWELRHWPKITEKLNIVDATPMAKIAVNFHIGEDWKIYDIPYNPVYVQKIESICKNFYFNHYLANVPPEVQNDANYKELLPLLYPVNKGEIRNADDKIAKVMNEMLSLKEKIKILEEEYEGLQAMVMDAIGDADSIISDTAIATWKVKQGSVKYKEVVDILIDVIKQHNIEIDMPAIFESCKSNPIRTFTIKEKK